MSSPEYPSEAHLARYALRAGDSRGRRYAEPEHDFRTPFQRDRDRIIHSTAFRRLQYKTQVFVNHDGDHYRTRLTHTLEVMQIARTLARALSLNEDLCEAVALAHDLGHTPFGHSGEEALNTVMQPFGGFEHNSHGLRVVDFLERRYPDFEGINLTYEVRESFARHSSRHAFFSDTVEFPSNERAPLESQIVVIADEIAYDNHDLDDGLRSGLLTREDVAGLELWQRAEESFAEELISVDSELASMAIIRRLIDMEVQDVIHTTQAALRKYHIHTPEQVRRHADVLVCLSSNMQRMKSELEACLKEKLYQHYVVTRMMTRSTRFLTDMFQAYCETPKMLPPEYQQSVARWGLERTVCDYLAGMTDRYTQQEYIRLFHPFEPTV